MSKNKNTEDVESRKVAPRPNLTLPRRHAAADGTNSDATANPNIPVVYQMIKAEVQNLLDKMTNAQIQDVVDSANKIRDKALLLKSPVKLEAPTGTLFPAEEQPPLSLSYSSTGQQANQLVNELTIRRREEMKLFRSLSSGANTHPSSKASIQTLSDTLPIEAELLPIILEQDDESCEVDERKTAWFKLGAGTNDGETSNFPAHPYQTLTATGTTPTVVLNFTNEPSETVHSKIQKSNDLRKLTVDGVQSDGKAIDILAEVARADHLMPLEELEQKLSSCRESGLSSRQVAIHRQRDGLNLLKQTNATPVWLQFFRSLVSGFGAILWLAAFLCFLAYWPMGDPPDPYNLILGVVLLSVIFVQGWFSFRQERKASNLIAGFLKMMPTTCRVLRDGSWTLVSAQDLVVGDVIRVQEGDKLPADIRIFDANEAKIEKSSLTGESDPIPLSAIPTDRNIYETQNMALFGTSMLEGAADGIVVNTGDRTIMGKIAQMASTTKTVQTTLQREIGHFTIVLIILAVTTCMATLLIYYLVVGVAHPGFLSTAVMVTNCIAITVALLPDGLPISVTTILTLVGRRLHREMILVKNLSITETLGSATLIASDKTGTITMNKMTLNHLWVGCGGGFNKNQQQPARHYVSRQQSLVYDESCVDYLEKSVPGCYHFNNMGKSIVDPALAFLLQAMCMCNKSNFERGPKRPTGRRDIRHELEPRKIVGSPTEGALLTASESFFDVDQFRTRVPIVDEIPFSSRRKFHLTIHQVVDNSVFETTELLLNKHVQNINSTSYYKTDSEFHIHCDNLDDNDNHKTKRMNSADYYYLVLVKGAPEYILSMCSTAIFDGQQKALGVECVTQIMKANEKLAMEGERVLAFAYKRLSSEKFPLGHIFDLRNQSDEQTKDLCLLGLAGIIDPPRPGVSDAIKECHEAGIRVMMVTGDHPTTAVAISRMVNIITNRKVKNYEDILNNSTPKNCPTVSCVATDDQSFSSSADQLKPADTKNKRRSDRSFFKRTTNKLCDTFRTPTQRQFLDESLVITGRDLNNLTKRKWDYVLSHKEIVFARTTPQQKLQIVKESQKRGDIIAVTGDGVNDAPALKAANLGVAMGLCGSDISKEAANMVLLDDNFVTIVNGIKQGRLLFDNLKKVVCYLLPAGSFSEILPVLAWVFFGLPQPLSAFLMIVICVGTDMCGSLGLVHEQAEFDLMRRPPRDSKNDRLVNWKIILFTYCFIGTIESAIAFFMYFFTMWLGNISPAYLIFAFEKWGHDFNVTVEYKNSFLTPDHNASHSAYETTYFLTITKDEQIRLNNKAQTAFFVSLVMTQLWNLLSVRTRFQSSLKQKFDPRLLWYMLGEVAIVLLICYLPVFKQAVGMEPAEWYHFVMPACLGSAIFGADELRKFFARRWPSGIFKRLAW